MRKVTAEEVQKLFGFTRKHYVEWYDVQTELVDHLANGIEDLWLENPHLSFEEALNNEFKKFGIFGFSDVVEQKTEALSKQYYKAVWKAFKEYFKLPKIIITVSSIYILFKILSLFENNRFLMISIAILLFAFQIFYFSKFLIRKFKLDKSKNKKWLFDQVLSNMGGTIYAFNIGIYYPLIDFTSKWNLLETIVFSTCAILYLLLLYIMIYVVTPKLTKDFLKQFPDYKPYAIV